MHIELEAASRVHRAAGNLVDDGALTRLAKDVGRANVALVLKAFLDELDRRAPGLQRAIDAADLNEIAALSHAIKGSALTFGAAPLGQAAASANELARTGDAGAVEQARCALALLEPTRNAIRSLDGVCTRELSHV